LIYDYLVACEFAV